MLLVPVFTAGAPNRCVYGSTKAAVIGLSRGIAADFIKDNIRCNSICPGNVICPGKTHSVQVT
jgi:2-keto-3-deoxy-L-fuconate dehydrogenase